MVLVLEQHTRNNEMKGCVIACTLTISIINRTILVQKNGITEKALHRSEEFTSSKTYQTFIHTVSDLIHGTQNKRRN